MAQILLKLTKHKTLRLRPLLLLLCLAAGTAYAQEQSYRSIFGETSTEWNVMFGACDAVATMNLNTSGTTLINDKEYIKISGNIFSSNMEDFLREDTGTGRVWMYDKSSNSELLLMDMTLERGDKFNLYTWNLTPVEAVVSEVYYENNLKHIRFRQQDALIWVCAGFDLPIPLEFIEGTGSNAGILYYNTFFQGTINSYILCHFKDGEKVYTSKKFSGTCYINQTSLEDDAEAAAVEVYPNPTTNDIKVAFNNPRQEQAELLLFDMLSRPVYRFTGREAEFQLLLRDKPAGVYFYRLSLNQKQVATGKIIKQ